MGVAVYLVMLRMAYGQMIARGDVAAVLAWSWVGALVAFLVVYLPCFLLLRKVLRGYTPNALFMLTGFALGIVPTLLIIWAFGGTIRSLLSHEAFLFTCLFATAGTVFGYGFAKLCEEQAATG
jgi:hypothetical protein